MIQSVPFSRHGNKRASAAIVIALGSIANSTALAQVAQVPPRFYLDSLAGLNAVPVIFESISGNANPLDSGHFISGNASIDADLAVVGFAKQIVLFDRSATVAALVPMGRLSGETTIAGRSFSGSANGFGDPMVEFNINLVGPDPILSIPDMMRYEPGFSLDLIADLAFPIGEYDDDQALNLGQNRWYGRVGTPMTLQIGDWVPGRRTTIELFPSVWFFSDNDDFVGHTLSTDPVFQLDAHLTRDFTEEFWGSLDFVGLAGGESDLDGMAGDSIDSLSIGLTLGYEINSNLFLTAGYLSTIDGPLDMDIFHISLVFGWHKLVEGMERLNDGM